MSSVIRGSDNFDSGLGLGVGQTWQNVLASRAAGTTYTNSSGKPISVAITLNSVNSQSVTLTVGGVTVGRAGTASSSIDTSQIFAVVPNNTSYVLNGNSSITEWAELR